jgi:hypothetical protein
MRRAILAGSRKNKVTFKEGRVSKSVRGKWVKEGRRRNWREVRCKVGNGILFRKNSCSHYLVEESAHSEVHGRVNAEARNGKREKTSFIKQPKLLQESKWTKWKVGVLLPFTLAFPPGHPVAVWRGNFPRGVQTVAWETGAFFIRLKSRLSAHRPGGRRQKKEKEKKDKRKMGKAEKVGNGERNG